MKTIIFTIAVLFASASYSVGQGIYSSVTDFTARRLSYTDNHIAPDRAFNASIVRITGSSGPVKLDKSTLYGYQDKHRQDFRFFDAGNYKILHEQPVMLYSREVYVVKGKVKTRETKHYFSKDAQSPVQELNKWNLKNAWPQHVEFHDLLDLHFPRDEQLLKYDPFRKEYTLIRLFNKSIGTAS